MKERPILFSAPMVRAILAGTKTQTRRVVKDRHIGQIDTSKLPGPAGWSRPMPYGQPGDRLWVRETWACFDSHVRPKSRIAYRSDTPDGEMVRVDAPWKPSIHMPRWASRITLEVTGVRVERLQDISEADALAEGVEQVLKGRFRIYGRETDGRDTDRSARTSYCSLWESINGPGSWDANPWVWVIEFKRVQP